MCGCVREKEKACVCAVCACMRERERFECGRENLEEMSKTINHEVPFRLYPVT